MKRYLLIFYLGILHKYACENCYFMSVCRLFLTLFFWHVSQSWLCLFIAIVPKKCNLHHYLSISYILSMGYGQLCLLLLICMIFEKLNWLLLSYGNITFFIIVYTVIFTHAKLFLYFVQIFVLSRQNFQYTLTYQKLTESKEIWSWTV